MKFEGVAKSFAQKTLPDSEVELSGEIPAEMLAPYRERALSHLAEHVELPGFRKGNVPKDIVLKKVGDVAVLEEAVELCMRDFYPELLEIQKVDAVGRPDIRITKLAPNNPVGIVLRATVYPNVALPTDWHTLAGKIELETVPDILDAEVDEALLSIRRARAKADMKTTDETNPGSTPQAEVASEALPALDDAFAQSLGKFSDVADLKAKLKENMKLEKEQQVKEKRRAKLIDALLEKTEVAVPVIFVDSELEKILSQLKEDVTRFGLQFEDYLKQMQKTEEQVREDFRDQARKRAKLQLTLNKLAVEEKIEADKEAIETEMKHAMEHFPDARPELVRIHIETVLRNEKALQLLENPKS